MTWSVARLPWDSDLFGREVGIARRADQPAVEPMHVGPTELAALDSSGFDLVYLLCDSDQLAHVREAECAGFRTVDLRCEVERCGVPPLRPRPRHVVAADAEALARAAALAGETHTNTRFGADPLLSEEHVRELYRRWIVRDSEAPGWGVLVALEHGDVAGYVSHGPGADGAGTIGLIGVRTGSRGRGLGRDLLDAALAAEAEQGRSTVRVVTHAAAVSRGMYQSAGFTVTSVKVWLHWHRTR